MSDLPSIADAARRIEAGTLSPVELTKTCLDRIKRLDPQVSAFITVTEDAALKAAQIAEEEIAAWGPRGPLHGIPIGLKDIFKTKGIATTAHSRHLLDYVPDEDAAVWERLRAAGAVLLGKTATHEFAFAGPSFDLPWPPARNPWNTDHFTAGSSSGNAAAIASGMMLGGVGSDTGGSIRSPAALCGIVGLKPTYGRVSRYGAFPTAYSMDHVGPMAWTVEDCAILLQALAGFDPRDPSSVECPVPSYRANIGADIRGVKIGVVRRFFEKDSQISQSMANALDAAFEIFRRLGADLRSVDLAPLEDWKAAGTIIMFAEAHAIHETRLHTRPDLFGELMRDQLAVGALITASDYIHALQRRRELAAEMAVALSGVDVLVGPTQASEAPRIDAIPKLRGLTAPSHTLPFNLTGYPALSMCCGYGNGDLPLSLQIAAKPFDESMILRVGHAYEQATEWRQRRPALTQVPTGRNME